MKKNSAAFALIKTLTMSEKRYFKIFSERHIIGERNKYVLLFEELDKRSTEDDNAIKNSLKKAGVHVGFISADKNYLYQLILASLNGFHDSRTYNLEIKEALLSIEILFHKGLYQECLKLIAKTEALAQECENFQLMIDVLMWKKRCSGYSLGLQKAAEVNLSIDKYIALLNNLKSITDLYYRSNLLQAGNEKFSKGEVLKKFGRILQQPELKNERNALSFSAKVYYHLIYSNYYRYLDKQAKELRHLEQLVALIHQSKTYAVEYPLDYISIYDRLLSSKKFFHSDSFFKDIEALNAFAHKAHIRKDVVQQRVFIHTHTHELEYYYIYHRYQQALSKTKAIEKEILKLNMDIEPYHMLYFYYMHALILTCVGEFSGALRFINKVLNDFKPDHRPAIYLQGEMLNAIIHYEMNNYTLVTSQAKHALKKNDTQKLLSPVEEKLLKVLLKLCASKNLTYKTETALLKPLMEETKTAPDNAMQFVYKWIAARLERKTVSDLFK
jgi:hypothetical protein